MNFPLPHNPLSEEAQSCQRNSQSSSKDTNHPDSDELAFNDLVDALRCGDFHARWDITKQISNLGEDALPHLLDLLQDGTLDQDGRWFVVRSLGHFDRPEVISALASLLATTDDEELHMVIGESLAQIGNNAILALTGWLQNSHHRPVAVQALARIRHPATVSPLLQVVNDANATIRATALQALAPFDQAAILPVIVNALSDTASQVRLAAVQGLVSFQRRVDPQQLVVWLIPRLWDVQLQIAQQAVYLLGRLDIESATEALVALINASSTPQPLQMAAIQALGWQATPKALQGLISVWDRVDPEAKLDIVRALEQLPATELRTLASDHLTIWLGQLSRDDTPSPLRRNMVLALGKLGNPSIAEVLRSHLTDPDPGVRLHAEAALTSLTQDG